MAPGSTAEIESGCASSHLPRSTSGFLGVRNHDAGRILWPGPLYLFLQYNPFLRADTYVGITPQSLAGELEVLHMRSCNQKLLPNRTRECTGGRLTYRGKLRDSFQDLGRIWLFWS